MTLSPALASTAGPASPDAFVRLVATGQPDELPAEALFAPCLAPLLAALGWRGQPRQLIEALPHCAEDLGLVDLCNVLALLGFRAQATRRRLIELDQPDLPCLFVARTQGPMLVLERTADQMRVFDPRLRREVELAPVPALKGVAYGFEPLAERATSKTRRQDRWSLELLLRFRRQLVLLAVLGFLTSLPGLITPMFVMALYDQVIPAASPTLLVQLTAAMATLMATDLMFRFVRARSMAFIATRIGRLVACTVLSKLLDLPPMALERAPMAAQLRRLRQFEAARDHFADPLVMVAFSLPYSVIFLTAISWLVGWLMLVPVGLMLLYAILVRALAAAATRHQAAAGEARQLRDGCFEEMVAAAREIRLLSAQAIWHDRFRNYSAGAALAGYQGARLQQTLQIVGQSAVTTAGATVLVLASLQAIEGQLTVGALIGGMALVWRVLAPWQQAIGLLPRVTQLMGEARRLDQLMRLPGESEQKPRRLAPRRSRGQLSFDGVALYFEGASRPALVGIDLKIEAGEMIAFGGPSGAGKSSLLKIAAGLCMPQAGSIRLDGADLRQMHQRELRESVAYAPQHPHVFMGTLAQNLRLAAPDASDQQLIEAAVAAGLLADIEKLPEGFATRVGDAAVRQTPGFIQRLSLARAYLRDSPVLLLDEPGRAIDAAADQALLAFLTRCRGDKTILMATHRPSHFKLAHRTVLLDAGRIVANRSMVATTPAG